MALRGTTCWGLGCLTPREDQKDRSQDSSQDSSLGVLGRVLGPVAMTAAHGLPMGGEHRGTEGNVFFFTWPHLARCLETRLCPLRPGGGGDLLLDPLGR